MTTMNIDLDALAARWTWALGALTLPGPRGRRYRFTEKGWTQVAGPRLRSRPDFGDARPDLTDELTALSLLPQVRRAWNAPLPSTRWCNLAGEWEVVIVGPDRGPQGASTLQWFNGDTEIEALAAALLAAPEKA